MNYDFLNMKYISAEENLKNVTAYISNDKDQRYFDNADFMLAMNSWEMPYLECSKIARECLLYPEMFSIIEGLQGYFTRRSGLDSYELRYTLEGTGELDYGGRHYALGSGDGFWIDCRQPHRYATVGDSWKCTVLHFGGRPVQAMFQVFGGDGAVTFSADAFPSFEALQERLLRSVLDISASGQFKTSCALDNLLTELLDQKQRARVNAQTAEHIQQIAAWMKAHCAERITGEALSRRFSISRAYLSTTFKAYTGLSPMDYLTQVRLNLAKSLLMNGGLSVDIVAQRSGYESASSFIRTFRQREGVTPLQYRKMWK